MTIGRAFKLVMQYSRDKTTRQKKEGKKNAQNSKGFYKFNLQISIDFNFGQNKKKTRRKERKKVTSPPPPPQNR